MKAAVSSLLALTLALTVAAPASAQQPPEPRLAALIGLARVRHALGDDKAASSLFAQADALKPFDAGLLEEWFWAGIGAEPDRALQVASRLLKVRPQLDDVRRRAINDAIAINALDVAQELAAAAAAAQPSSGEWSRDLARIADRRGDRHQALTARARVANLGDATDEDFAALADTAEQLHDPQAALQAWSRIAPERRDANPAWSRGAIRALVDTGASAAAADAFDRHRQRYGEDAGIRALVVDALARDQHFERAFTLAGPLTTGNDSAHWAKRAVEFAVALHDPAAVDTAVSALERLQPLDATQLAWRADARLSMGRTSDASTDITALQRVAVPCDARPLELLERLGDGDRLATSALTRDACTDAAAWRIRAARDVAGTPIERRIVELLAPLDAAAALPVGDAVFYGELLDRIGDVEGAVRVLSAATTDPDLGAQARTALVDLHLGHGRVEDAWTLIAPAVRANTDGTNDERWLRVGLEAGHPDQVLAVLEGRSPAARAALKIVEASALEASNQFAAAAALFDTAPLDRFEQPRDALRYIDAVDATDGPIRANAVAERFTADTTAWIEVVARRALLAARVGDEARSRQLSAVVAKLDRDRHQLLTAEIALAGGRPEQAIDAVAPMLTRTPDDRRALELRSAAFVALHEWPRAVDDTRRLLAIAPTPLLAAREAEYAWRAQPNPASFDTFLDAARTANVPDALLAAARALREAGRPADALAFFGEQRQWVTLEAGRRAELLQTLLALERNGDALAIVENDMTRTYGIQLMRAQVISRSRGAIQARPLFTALAHDADVTPDVYLAWAASESGPERTDVLAEGLQTFPASADLLLASARDALIPRPAAAQGLLDRARASAPTRLDVWTTSFDLAVRQGRAADIDTLLAEANKAIGDRGLRRDLALHLTGLVSGTSDRLAGPLTTWANQLVAARPGGREYMLRARVRAALSQWNGAIADADRAIRDDSTMREAMRLKADLLSYAGSYGASVTAYHTYLDRYPDDLDAGRQLARVLGWAQRYDEARAQYRMLVDAHPTDARLRLEAEAKSAMFDERWDDARTAYARLISAEPDNQEAIFESAQATRAGGSEAGAIALLTPLAVQQPAHRQSVLALDTWAMDRRPSLEPFSLNHSASGEHGQRTLALNETGVTGGVWMSSPGRLWLGVRANAVSVDAAAGALDGSRVIGALRFQANRHLLFEAAGGRFALGPTATAVYDVSGRLVVAQRVAVGVRATQDAWLENITTARLGLTTSDLRANVDVTFPRWSATTALRRREFSDDNSSWMAESTGRVRLATGRTEWHAFTWIAQEQVAHESPLYFSPASFTRADVGLEWRRWLSRPRFRDDRERSLTASYAFGVDSRAYVYHHPAARLAFELRRGVALEARGSWLESPAYRSTDVSVSVRLGGTVAPAAAPVR